jgi:hypothetical protein
MTNVPTRASRRQLLLALGALPLAGLAHAAAPSPAKGAKAAAPTTVEVWKEASCGCCKDWIAHMEANGFKVFVNTGGTNAARARFGIPQNMASCHTARVGGYTVEGHVPAREVRRLLREKPVAVGLAAPGMPIGSPGMDTPAYNGKKNPYNVMLIAKDGSASIYQKYEGNNL